MRGREEKVLPAQSVWPMVSGDQEWHPLPESTVQELPQVELIIVPSGHLGKQATGTEAGAASASHGSAIWASWAPWPGPAHTGTRPAQEARSPMSQRSKAQPLRHPLSVQSQIHSRGVGSGFLMRPLVPTSSRPGSSSEESWTGARRGAQVRSLPYTPCHVESSFPALVPSLCLLSPCPLLPALPLGGQQSLRVSVSTMDWDLLARSKCPRAEGPARGNVDRTCCFSVCCVWLGSKEGTWVPAPEEWRDPSP